MPCTIVDHPLAQHLLMGLRDRETEPASFRQMSRVLSSILILEATRSVRTATTTVKTPLSSCQAQQLGQGLAVVPVLRAGLAMLESALMLFPDVAVGYIGLERSHQTGIAQSYYCKLPSLEGRFTLCFDPMLATGGSASQALAALKAGQPESLSMVCVVAAPEGVRRLEVDHPDVPIYTAAVDERLDEMNYIVPGLGDFGDRLFGTL